jgi:sRNA-binding protein
MTAASTPVPAAARQRLTLSTAVSTETRAKIAALQPSQKRARQIAAAVLLVQLKRRWPKLFAARPVRVMALGIYEAILARIPRLAATGSGRALLMVALSRHTARTDYQAAVLTVGTPRYDLDGNVAGAVTATEVERHMAWRRSDAKWKHRRYCRARGTERSGISAASDHGEGRR